MEPRLSRYSYTTYKGGHGIVTVTTTGAFSISGKKKAIIKELKKAGLDVKSIRYIGFEDIEITI